MKFKKHILFIVISCFIIMSVLDMISCALFRSIEINDFTSPCSHCHGKNLEGVSNTKLYCGNCHDITSELTPENIKDENMREAVLSEPHIHKIRNVFTGTPSCFYCHREGDF